MKNVSFYPYFADSLDCTSLSFVSSLGNVNVFPCTTLNLRGYRIPADGVNIFFDTSVTGNL